MNKGKRRSTRKQIRYLTKEQEQKQLQGRERSELEQGYGEEKDKRAMEEPVQVENKHKESHTRIRKQGGPFNTGGI